MRRLKNLVNYGQLEESAVGRVATKRGALSKSIYSLIHKFCAARRRVEGRVKAPHAPRDKVRASLSCKACWKRRGIRFEEQISSQLCFFLRGTTLRFYRISLSCRANPE